jgi:tetratricopeptide (TPR) repeat protein
VLAAFLRLSYVYTFWHFAPFRFGLLQRNALMNESHDAISTEPPAKRRRPALALGLGAILILVGTLAWGPLSEGFARWRAGSSSDQELTVRVENGLGDHYVLEEAAKRALAKGNFEAAITPLKALRKSGKGDAAWATIELARCALKVDDIDTAFGLLEEAVKRWPERADVYEARADFYAETDDLPPQVIALKKLSELRPNNVDVARRLARVAYEDQQTDIAREAYKQVAVLDQKDDEAVRRAGYLTHLLGDPIVAGGMAERAMMLDPNDGRNLLLLATVEASLPDPNARQKAEPLLRQAIKRNPNIPGAHVSLGLLELSRNHPDLAAVSLKRAVELDPYQPQTILSLVGCLQRLGRKQEAANYQAHYRKLDRARQESIQLSRRLEKNSQNLDLHRQISRLYLVTGQWRAARRHIRPYLREHPEDKEAAADFQRCSKALESARASR